MLNKRVSRSYIHVRCPYFPLSIRKVPVASFENENKWYVTNTCDFSNGACNCDRCCDTIQHRMDQDYTIVGRSHSEPVELYYAPLL